MRAVILTLVGWILAACGAPVNETANQSPPSPSPIIADAPLPTVGGGQFIPISTAHGDFKVWTKRIGNNPSMKVLLLHGGPGMTHEIYEVFQRHFPEAGIEFYYYDQLGSYFSDQPEDPDLWQTARFVEEVEQVRQALGLTADNFYLFGQSWGGILGLEYALKYQDNLKGLIVANMMASIPAYNTYARTVLMADMDPGVLAELEELDRRGDFTSPRYEELLIEHHYVDHVLRMPVEAWPEEVNRAFSHLNKKVYIPMQGPSELGARGTLGSWDRTEDLHKIKIPTLIIGATHDTMDPVHMEWMAGEVVNGRFLLCPNGSHLAQYDDEAVFFEGLIDFIHDVDAGRY